MSCFCGRVRILFVSIFVSRACGSYFHAVCQPDITLTIERIKLNTCQVPSISVGTDGCIDERCSPVCFAARTKTPPPLFSGVGEGKEGLNLLSRLTQV